MLYFLSFGEAHLLFWHCVSGHPSKGCNLLDSCGKIWCPCPHTIEVAHPAFSSIQNTEHKWSSCRALFFWGVEGRKCSPPWLGIATRTPSQPLMCLGKAFAILMTIRRVWDKCFNMVIWDPERKGRRTRESRTPKMHSQKDPIPHPQQSVPWKIDASVKCTPVRR